MRKIYALFLLLGLSLASFGQTYLSEDFSSGIMPPAGWTIDNLANQWSISNTNSAGGVSPEGMFTYISQTATTRLISPSVDLTGLTQVTLMFSHYYNVYTSPVPMIGVATRHGSGGWTSVWEVTPTGNVGPETKVLTIMSTDVGHSDFQFCFYLQGNLYNMNYWYLDDILLYNPSATDLSLTLAQLPQYSLIGDTNLLTGKVKNLGTNPITSFDVSFAIDGGSPQVHSFTGLNLAIGDSYDFSDPDQLIFNTLGNHSIPVKIQNVNGGTDDNPANDTLSRVIGIVPYRPDKKVFCEEATGTWCGWCVRGICYMNYMEETYPDTWIGVAVHNTDPMVDPPYDAAIPNIIPDFQGYPSGTIDRAGGISWDPEDFEQGYLQNIKIISPATISVVNFTYDPGTRTADFDVQSDILVDISHELRFCAVISEDSVWGRGTTWAQHNYYAGGGYGPMCGFESLPGVIADSLMHYDHVARAILDTPYGTAGSIPSPALGGSTYSHHYTVTLDASWNYAKLHFYGIILDNVTGEILNSTNELIALGAKTQKQDISLAVYPNPFSSDATLAFTLKKQQNVELKVLDLLGNVVYQENQRTYPAGENKIILHGNLFNNGMYIAELLVDGQIHTRKISVIK
ncbi:MAG TPA: T9SS type A sorting domain-containing protein [Bacteroidales bacterium]|nr:T9SS type A sorting domain-containing protein [Bacteroidales bacterium]